MAVERLPTSDGGTPTDPRQVGEGLDRLLRGLGAPRGSTVAGVHDRWAELVGPAIAAHSRPVRVRDGVLIVGVDDPLWASELRWLGDELAARVRAVLNDDSVKRIEVRVVPAGADPGRSDGSGNPPRNAAG